MYMTEAINIYRPKGQKGKKKKKSEHRETKKEI